jgi:hypothetical protein
VHPHQLGLGRLGEQRVVELFDRPAGPQRVVIFISVVGCGTRAPSGIRQNRRQVNESATSAHSGS